jgi:hypothetical protein
MVCKDFWNLECSWGHAKRGSFNILAAILFTTARDPAVVCILLYAIARSSTLCISIVSIHLFNVHICFINPLPLSGEGCLPWQARVKLDTNCVNVSGDWIISAGRVSPASTRCTGLVDSTVAPSWRALLLMSPVAW